MNKLIQTVGLAALLSASSVYAGNACEGFQIKIKNNLQDDVIVNTLDIAGGEFEPNGIPKIDKKSEGVFTLSKADSEPMLATIGVNAISIPYKSFEVKFTLKDKNLICEHDQISTSGNVHVDKTRLPGHVVYTID